MPPTAPAHHYDARAHQAYPQHHAPQPSIPDEEYAPPRRRVGGWIVALVLFAGVSVIGFVVAKQYFAHGPKPAATLAPLDPKAQQLLSDGERAFADGNLDVAKEDFDKASALADKDPRRLARRGTRRRGSRRRRVGSRCASRAAGEAQIRARKELDELSVKSSAAADAALAATPDDPPAVRSKIDALRIAGDLAQARALVTRMTSSSIATQAANRVRARGPRPRRGRDVHRPHSGHRPDCETRRAPRGTLGAMRAPLSCMRWRGQATRPEQGESSSGSSVSPGSTRSSQGSARARRSRDAGRRRRRATQAMRSRWRRCINALPGRGGGQGGGGGVRAGRSAHAQPASRRCAGARRLRKGQGALRTRARVEPDRLRGRLAGSRRPVITRSAISITPKTYFRRVPSTRTTRAVDAGDDRHGRHALGDRRPNRVRRRCTRTSSTAFPRDHGAREGQNPGERERRRGRGSHGDGKHDGEWRRHMRAIRN